MITKSSGFSLKAVAINKGAPTVSSTTKIPRFSKRRVVAELVLSNENKLLNQAPRLIILCHGKVKVMHECFFDRTDRFFHSEGNFFFFFRCWST